MPWSDNNGGPQDGGPKASGPWGGGGGRGPRRGGGGGGGQGPWGGGGGNGSGRPPGRGPVGGGGGGGQGPNIDDFLKRGQSQLKNALGDGGGSGAVALLALVLLAGAWIYQSVFIVQPDERAVVLTFGECVEDCTVGPGLNFAPWPVQTAEIRPVLRENTVEVGVSEVRGPRARDDGLMLTGDLNVIDINFQVVWVIDDLQSFLFNIADPELTIRAVAESAMREVVGREELLPLISSEGIDDRAPPADLDEAMEGGATADGAPALDAAATRERTAEEVEALIQETLNGYDAGIRIVRLTLDRADAPPEVIDAFQDVIAARQERETLQQQAEAYYNQQTRAAEGRARRLIEEAEGYRAQTVADAQGQAARFESILAEYIGAEGVTRQRLYLETMERVLGELNMVIIDETATGGSGVLPLLQLQGAAAVGSGAAGAAGSRN